MGRPVAVLNALVLPGGGLFDAREISEHEARYLAQRNGVDSFVRHESTARVLSAVLGETVAVNAQRCTLVVGDIAIAMRLNLPRGQLPKEFDEDEVRQFGFRIYRLERLA